MCASESEVRGTFHHIRMANPSWEEKAIHERAYDQAERSWDRRQNQASGVLPTSRNESETEKPRNL